MWATQPVTETRYTCNMSVTLQNSMCAHCGDTVERVGTRGPVPKYCSNAHRQAAHRLRHRLAGEQPTSTPQPLPDLGALVLRHRRAILDIAGRRGASNVRLFGSVARGSAHTRSDIDLLVDLDDGVSLVGLAGLQRELEELLGRHVDVVPAAHLKAGLHAEVEAEAIAL